MSNFISVLQNIHFFTSRYPISSKRSVDSASPDQSPILLHKIKHYRRDHVPVRRGEIPHDNALQVVKRPAFRYFARDTVQVQLSLPDAPIEGLTVGPYQTGDPCGLVLGRESRSISALFPDLRMVF